MASYLVSWSIVVEAESPLEAVEESLSMMPSADNDSTATVFDVQGDEDGDKDEFEIDLRFADQVAIVTNRTTGEVRRVGI